MNLEIIRSNAIRNFGQEISCRDDGSVLFSDNKIIFIEERNSILELSLFFRSEWEAFANSGEFNIDYQGLDLRLNRNDHVLDISFTRAEAGVDIVLVDLAKQYIGSQKVLQGKTKSSKKEHLFN